MRYHALTMLLVLAVPLPAAARDVPALEAFGGYSFSRNRDENMHGWNAGLTLNLQPWLGVEADLAGHYQTLALTDLSRLSALLGPRVPWRRGALAPFAHALIGALRTRARTEVLDVSLSESDTHLGFALGAGLEVGLWKRWLVRATGDYIWVRSPGHTDGDPRLSVGLVVGLGRLSRP